MLTGDKAGESRPGITVFHSEMNTPMGIFFLGATSKGVCAVCWSSGSKERFIANASRRVSLAFVRDDGMLGQVKDELNDYFNGKAEAFTVEVDLPGLTGFEQAALQAARNIQYGMIQSYGDVARAAGRPGAARAVGNALGKNPVPIIIPCHRVIKTGGDIGGFTGGLDNKRFLMSLEGIKL